MAHRAGPSRGGEGDAHLLGDRRIAMEQEVALLDLLHEHLLVGFQLLRRHRVLVGAGRPDQDGGHDNRSGDGRTPQEQRNVDLVVIAIPPLVMGTCCRRCAAA